MRNWVRQAEVDAGHALGTTTELSTREKALEQENRELRRANEILKCATSFFGEELDRQYKI